MLRIASRELTYSDEERKAEFTGGVQMDGADRRYGWATGQVVYLQAAGEGGMLGRLQLLKQERIYGGQCGAGGGDRKYCARPAGAARATGGAGGLHRERWHVCVDRDAGQTA